MSPNLPFTIDSRAAPGCLTGVIRQNPNCGECHENLPDRDSLSFTAALSPKLYRSGILLDAGPFVAYDIPDRENVAVTTEQIGAIVREARVAQGLRQDQLAAAAGVGVRFLVELEGGKSTVRLGKVLAVLDALGCRLAIAPPPTSPGPDS